MTKKPNNSKGKKPQKLVNFYFSLTEGKTVLIFSKFSFLVNVKKLFIIDKSVSMRKSLIFNYVAVYFINDFTFSWGNTSWVVVIVVMSVNSGID